MTELEHQERKVKTDVRSFYDKVGWKMEADGFYQNAVYEDIRPVSREYIHQCHLRVKQHLAQTGNFLLDAGSGPIQWPEYLTYSEGYCFRVCVDLSIEGLKEARKRIGEHGLFVVADITHLPFKTDAFDGVVSLHTIHHVPADEKTNAYIELFRCLQPGKTAVVVNGWGKSLMMERWSRVVSVMERFFNKRERQTADIKKNAEETIKVESIQDKNGATIGTYIEKEAPEVLRKELAPHMQFEILVWRSVSVRFLRAVVHPWLCGKLFLRWLFRQEEQYPQRYGERGQYPMIVLYK